MKKFALMIFIPLIISFAAFFLIQFINYQHSQKGALQVTTMPESEVYLNNKYIGRTPISKTEPDDMIQTGDYLIKLVPTDKKLAEYQEKISITSGTMTVVDRKFRSGALSEGYLISLNQLNNKNKTELEVISFPSGSDVILDSNSQNKTPLLLKSITESDHEIRITKNAYREKIIKIRTPSGYRLSLIVYLSPLSQEELNILQQAKQSIIPSLTTPTPSPTKQIESKVVILNTPTGFLRVRTTPSLDSNILTTVSPGDVYAFIGEQGDWYEIKLNDGKSGWISRQYAKKQ